MVNCWRQSSGSSTLSRMCLGRQPAGPPAPAAVPDDTLPDEDDRDGDEGAPAGVVSATPSFTG
jgi:hypothetical protein